MVHLGLIFAPGFKGKERGLGTKEGLVVGDGGEEARAMLWA